MFGTYAELTSSQLIKKRVRPKKRIKQKENELSDSHTKGKQAI